MGMFDKTKEGDAEGEGMDRDPVRDRDNIVEDTVCIGPGVTADCLEVPFLGRIVRVYVTQPTAKQMADHDAIYTHVTKGKKVKIQRIAAHKAVAPQCIVDVHPGDLTYVDENDQKTVMCKDMPGGVEAMRKALVQYAFKIVNEVGNELFMPDATTSIEGDDEEDVDPLDDGSDR